MAAARKTSGLRFGKGERELCRSLAEFFPKDARVLVPIGDDAAIVRTTARTVITVDPVVAGVHFEPDTPPTRIGRKAVNRSLSDLAAMGAKPEFLVVSILLPDGFGHAAQRALLRGIRDAADVFRVCVVGGDVGRTPGPLTLTVTALGAAPERPLRRDALRAGMELRVTGKLGGSRLGRHLRFEPRIADGQALARHPSVPAAMDISDGLLLDLQTMLVASGGLGAVLLEAGIPIHADARKAARQSGRSPLWHALHDGEDHELLFGVRPGARLSRGIVIGTVRAKPGIVLDQRDGGRISCEPTGYEHDL